MSLLAGINHVATLTADLDRLKAFYVAVFDAETVMELREGPLRHAFIRVGPSTVLHPFEIDGNTQAGSGQPLFGRGRIDHVALQAASSDAFYELCDRLVAGGSSEGVISDFGVHLSFSFTDPDGMDLEVCWAPPGASPANAVATADSRQLVMSTRRDGTQVGSE